MKKTLIFGIILASALFYHSISLKAHDVAEKWIYINNSADILIENSIPNPSKLEWAAHIVNNQFEINENITFKIDSEVLEHNLEIDSSQLRASWEFSDGDKIESFEFSKSFLNYGNYFLTIKIFNQNSERLEEERIMLIVGENPLPSAILVNGEREDNGIYQINRSSEVTFSIINANPNFQYSWDLADVDVFEGITVSKKFQNTRLPAYVILRTTDPRINTFTDSYVRLESSDNASFEVVTPAVKPTEGKIESVTREINPVLPFSAAVFIAVMGIFGARKLIRK